MKLKSAIAVFLVLFPPAFLAAQEYILEVRPDNKVIHVKNLGMPDQTSVQDVLLMIPELMSRGDELFDKFDIQYDGKSVGMSRDVILSQTLLNEVEDIVISTSSVATQSKNGQSGVINIVPRRHDEGFGGEALLSGTTEWDVMPSVGLDYRKGPLELRGKLNMEYYRPDGVVEYTDFSPARTVNGLDLSSEKYLQQTAKVDLKYTFSNKDVLKAWVVESWGSESQHTDRSRKTIYDKTEEVGPGWLYQEFSNSVSDTWQRSLDFNAAASYTHSFDKGASLSLSSGYSMTRSKTHLSMTRPHTVDASMSAEGVVCDSGGHKLVLAGGVNTMYKIVNSSDLVSNSIYVSPYFQMRWNYSGLKVNATVRYQYFGRDMDAPSIKVPYTSDEHDIVANLSSLWQICPHHALRLNLSRNLVRPGDQMLYPLIMYYFSMDKYAKGNPDLKRAFIHSAELGYITDWNDNGHTVIFNLGLGYDRADGIIQSRSDFFEEGSLVYTTYANSGINNIFKTNLALVYRYSILTLSFAGNFYHNDIINGTDKDHYTCYNLSLSPMLSFKHGWVLTSRFLYNSAVKRAESTLGDCIFGQARLSKSYRNWTFSAAVSDIFDYVTTDMSSTSTQYGLLTNVYNLYTLYFELGVSCRFGTRSAVER